MTKKLKILIVEGNVAEETINFRRAGCVSQSENFKFPDFDEYCVGSWKEGEYCSLWYRIVHISQANKNTPSSQELIDVCHFFTVPAVSRTKEGTLWILKQRLPQK